RGRYSSMPALDANQPSGSIRASVVKTGTVSPTGTRIFVSFPVAGATSMLVTFSVSTSAISSSSATRSPSCFSQTTIVPSVIPMPNGGKWTSVDTRRQFFADRTALHDGSHRRSDPFRVGVHERLEGGAEGRMHVRGGHPGNRGTQAGEALLRHDG